jgi:hypothetical protein
MKMPPPGLFCREGEGLFVGVVGVAQVLLFSPLTYSITPTTLTKSTSKLCPFKSGSASITFFSSLNSYPSDQ